VSDGAPARRVVLASANAGKQREFAALIASQGIELILQSELGIASIEETGDSFEANALLKARHAALLSGLPALADDSGLEVDALEARPGIHSARYAGAGASDENNMIRLLSELLPVAAAARTARYRCVLALVRSADDPRPLLARGSWSGRIATTPRGEHGFGYDPLFLPDDLPPKGPVGADGAEGEVPSAAQIPPELKNRLSHRAAACNALLRQMQLTSW
jgi:XTP/dITP diphosphohydrolase